MGKIKSTSHDTLLGALASTLLNTLLGSVTGLAVAGGAHAAGLPVKTRAIEYVKVCSLYGAGFYYIPGTDTCLRIGGYMRAEFTTNGPGGGLFVNDQGGLQNRLTNNYNSRARFMVYLDSRTATDYGVVRTFAAVAPQFTMGTATDTQGNGSIRVENAFVQFAGFTFGRSASAYAYPWENGPGDMTGALFGGPAYDAGINNIQYGLQLGSGMSLNLGLDSQEQASRGQIVNYAAGISPTGTNGVPIGFANNGFYGGSNIPDIVGSFKIDQPWAYFQVSGAVHQVNAAYYGAVGNAESLGHPDDKWGFAVSGVLQLKNLPTGPGDDLKLTAVYTEGALRYLIGQSVATPTNIAYFGAYELAMATISDASYGGSSFVNGSGLQLTKGWGMNGAFNHNWNANWVTSLFGSYSHIAYNGTATLLYCNAFYANAGTAPVTCNPNFNIGQVGVNVSWTPVKGLAFRSEVMWSNYDTSMRGTTTAAFNPGNGKAPGPYTYRSMNALSGMLRVQRNY